MSFDTVMARLDRGWLPKTSSDWMLADEDGWSVAHEVAKRRTLPADFPHWSLADQSGYTVAHVAAQYGHLVCPESCLDFVDHSGTTVAHLLARRGELPPSLQRSDVLRKTTSAGVSVQDLIREKVKARIQHARAILKTA